MSSGQFAAGALLCVRIQEALKWVPAGGSWFPSQFFCAAAASPVPLRFSKLCPQQLIRNGG
jgi:hypothetical protein